MRTRKWPYIAPLAWDSRRDGFGMGPRKISPDARFKFQIMRSFLLPFRQTCKYSWRGIASALAIMAAMALALPLSARAAGNPAAVIKMSDKPPVFSPAKVTIKAGQTVRWVNNAATLHSVDATPDDVINKADVSLPPGAPEFDSGFMQPGGTFDYTFTIPGTYRYTCIPHEKDGMNGTIIVTK